MKHIQVFTFLQSFSDSFFFLSPHRIVVQELEAYMRKMGNVSAACRLTPSEELTLLEQHAPDSKGPYLFNRLVFLRAMVHSTTSSALVSRVSGLPMHLCFPVTALKIEDSVVEFYPLFYMFYLNTI